MKINNTFRRKSLKIGVTLAHRGDELGHSIAATIKDIGYETIIIPMNGKLPDLDIVFAYGPFTSLTPLTNQLASYTLKRRPKFILWLTEQLPNPQIPEWIRYPASIFRSRLERACYVKDDENCWQLRNGAHWVTRKGHRYRYYGDLFWLKRSNILSVLAIPSQWTANFLRQRNFNPVTACISTKPSEKRYQEVDRDIPVLWLGKTGSKRRKRLLMKVRSELSDRGVEMLVIDGVENPYVFGEERTKLLNRTKITINLLREKWDDNTLRYFFAAANYVLVISEPSLPHSPFLPGKHIVEAPLSEFTDKICYYLSHDNERREITASAYELVTTDLTLEKSLIKIIGQI
jgi:hypothetical protein